MRKKLYPGLLAELARHGETYEQLGKAIGISVKKALIENKVSFD